MEKAVTATISVKIFYLFTFKTFLSMRKWGLQLEGGKWNENSNRCCRWDLAGLKWPQEQKSLVTIRELPHLEHTYYWRLIKIWWPTLCAYRLFMGNQSVLFGLGRASMYGLLLIFFSLQYRFPKNNSLHSDHLVQQLSLPSCVDNSP